MSYTQPHPYLTGNYAPICTILNSEPCGVEGSIPDEFLGGQYVRNGSNPLNDDNQRDHHWFDGDGMLTGVFFKRLPDSKRVQPLFTNQYVLTDVHCAATQNKRLYPIIPSMATLVNPSPSRFRVLLGMLRTYIIVFASLFKLIARPIKRVGAANTSVFHHDGRVMATNEIGPPMRVLLPSLQTIGWFTGTRARGESKDRDPLEPHFGCEGIEGFYKEMTTAHPRVDRTTGELMLFHSTFLPPFIHYSIVPAGDKKNGPRLNLPVPGISSGKLMHDFGVSRQNTVIVDCPVSSDPSNLAQNKAVVVYDPEGFTRLGVFPRHFPERIRWYETDPCIVMHTANTWDETTPLGMRVHILVCRINSLAPLYHMGGMEAPASVCPQQPECRLYYYQILSGLIQQWALSAIPFEFPHVPRHLEMTAAQFIYGCSMRQGNFVSSTIGNVKIDCLVKMDVWRLLELGEENPPTKGGGVVDERTIQQVISSEDLDDPIQVFALPDRWYAQECSFVSRQPSTREDDGWLITYVFDESQLNDNGEASADSKGELWIIDAIGMKDVVARISLPQRVPYGMHGNWFPEEEILNQRDYAHVRIK